jgi:hypothetical protein
MILKLEDDVYAFGASYEYVNTDNIFRIVITRKRIKIYSKGIFLSCVYVGKTKHNMKELKKLDKDMDWE